MPATSSDEEKASVLVRRRSILLALCAATSVEAKSLQSIIQNGYLMTVKGWLDDILSGSTGGIDYLTHMLNSLAHLPVTRETVASSKLGRAVVAIEKHTLFTSLKDATAAEDMKKRIHLVKNEWSAIVKREKEASTPTTAVSSSPTAKRTRDTISNSGSELSSKKTKVSSISDLIRRGTTEKQEPISAAEAARQRAKERQAAESARLQEATKPLAVTKSTSGKNVNWADEAATTNSGDNAGGKFETVHEYEAEYAKKSSQRRNVTDQRKQELLDERKHLEDAKKAHAADLKTKLDAMAASVASTPWRTPAAIASPFPQPANSVDVQNEARRMTSVQQTLYTAANNNLQAIPDEPTPLSEIEQTLEMTAVSTAPPPTVIPFFLPKEVEVEQVPPQMTVIPQQPPQPASAVPQYHHQGAAPPAAVPMMQQPPPQIMPAAAVAGATPEMVRALGLPSFLVGSNVNALNTLAASPSLMSSFVDAQGRFDQARLLHMVQVLSNSNAPGSATNPTPQQPQQPQYGNTAAAGMYGTNNYYGAPTTQTQTQMQQQPPSAVSYYGTAHAQAPQQPINTATNTAFGSYNGSSAGYKPKNYRGEQNGDGNLHLSGYGHNTSEAEIYALFSQYVHVDEVVMKSTFSFINTSDPAGAQRAMMMLQGSYLGGRPIKISTATRRAPDPSRRNNASTAAGAADSAYTYTRGSNVNTTHATTGKDSVSVLPASVNANGEIDLDSVYDDRGNVATKNLFVAGYGAGTTEQMLQSIFSQFGTVTGIVMKSTFSFVNTNDRSTAVRAREALTGSNMNGGNLRINFAKESGRLGTSFDASRGGAASSHQSSSMTSYYGRS